MVFVLVLLFWFILDPKYTLEEIFDRFLTLIIPILILSSVLITLVIWPFSALIISVILTIVFHQQISEDILI